MNKKFLLLCICLISFVVACTSQGNVSINVPSTLEMRQAQSLQITATNASSWSITPLQVGVLSTDGTRATYFSPNQILQPLTVTITVRNTSNAVSITIYLLPENLKSEIQIQPLEY
jgi:archaellum component FlaF (FlaF/FlaG flagellin family)